MTPIIDRGPRAINHPSYYAPDRTYTPEQEEAESLRHEVEAIANDLDKGATVPNAAAKLGRVAAGVGEKEASHAIETRECAQ